MPLTPQDCSGDEAQENGEKKKQNKKGFSLLLLSISRPPSYSLWGSPGALSTDSWFTAGFQDVQNPSRLALEGEGWQLTRSTSDSVFSSLPATICFFESSSNSSMHSAQLSEQHSLGGRVEGALSFWP